MEYIIHYMYDIYCIIYDSEYILYNNIEYRI